jgi:endoglucanase
MKFVAVIITPLLLATGLIAQPKNPIKMATQARVDLQAMPEVGGLDKPEILSLGGKLERLQWASATERGAGWAAHFPIYQYGWTEFSLQVTPASNGTVMLKLMAPVEDAGEGRIYRQEVVWDEVSITGASSVITNGSFEELVGNRPLVWEGGGVSNAGPMPPLKGVNYGRTWLNRTLMQSITVRGGQPVTLRLFARSVPIIGPQEMMRIRDRDTLAHESAANYLRGVNLGNFLEVPPGQTWSLPHTEADFWQIKAEGFDHVRIPIGWHHYAGPAPAFKITNEFFVKVDTVVSNALKQGLFVIINLHHFDEFTTNPTAHTNKFLAIWQQIAVHYSRAHPGIAFELLNEPKDAATTEALNPIYAKAIQLIRASNPFRTIFLGPGKWNSAEELGKLWLSPEEDNVIVTVHCYEPFYFTHQSASWAGPEVKGLQGIVYPGPPPQPLQPAEPLKPGLQEWIQNYNTKPADRNPVSSRIIRTRLKQAKDWSDFYGRPVHVGEFGCYIAADPASRSRYYADFRKILDEYKLGWAMWDWKAGFKYWDAQTKQPAPGMREAMFPKPKVQPRN